MIKKAGLTIFLYIIFIFNVFAQNRNGFVSGAIIEDSTKLPLEFVNIALITSENNSVIGNAVSDKKGNFKIDSINAGNYFLQISFIGFETNKTPSFQVKANTETALGTISLQVSKILLKDVDVTTQP